MTQCTNCSSPQVASLWLVRDSADYRLYFCQSCNVRFIAPQPSDEFLGSLYTKTYYDAWGYEENSQNVRAMKMATFMLRLRQIKRFKLEGKVLDVGCATGFFLEAAQKEGFEPYGVEFSMFSSSVAKKKFGDEAIYNGVLEDSQFPDGSFDVIAMSDLLEHVKTPQAVMAKAAALLKPDGIIMVMTPDTGSLTHRLMGEKWVHYKIEHLFYFNTQALEMLANEHQLELVRVEPAKKSLTLDYLHCQFEVYPHWLLTPLLRVANKLLPASLRHKHLYFTIGEMVAILRKRQCQ